MYDWEVSGFGAISFLATRLRLFIRPVAEDRCWISVLHSPKMGFRDEETSTYVAKFNLDIK